MKYFIFAIQVLPLLWCFGGMAQTYKCKFSAPGAKVATDFDGSAPLEGFMAGGFDFSVKPISLKFTDSGNEMPGIIITATGMGIKTAAVAPMGTAVIGIINETFDVRGSCKLQ